MLPELSRINIKFGSTFVVVAFAKGTVAKSTVAAYADIGTIILNRIRLIVDKDANSNCEYFFMI